MRFLSAMFLATFALAALAAPAFAQSSMSSVSGMSTMPKCKSGDPVVWINTRSKVYYTKGAAYYGKTAHGKYACTSSAVAAGAHPPATAHNSMMNGYAAPHAPRSMASPGSPKPLTGGMSPLPHMSSSPSP